MTIPDVIGVLGGLSIVIAYSLLSKSPEIANRFHYHALNLLGGMLLLVSLVYNPNIGSLLVEFFWISISIRSLSRILSDIKPQNG